MCRTSRQLWHETGEYLAKLYITNKNLYLLLFCCYIRVTNNCRYSSQLIELEANDHHDDDHYTCSGNTG